MSSTFSVNMTHVRAIPIDAENVDCVEKLLATDGKFQTIDDYHSQQWRDWLCENNVFYTETVNGAFLQEINR